MKSIFKRNYHEQSCTYNAIKKYTYLTSESCNRRMKWHCEV